MKTRILLFLVGLLLVVSPTGIKATYLVSYHSYGVTDEEQKLIKEENNNAQLNVFDALKYRMIEKDTKDAIDYVILVIIIILMLTVIIDLNRKTYVIPGNVNVFAEESTSNDSVDSEVVIIEE